MVNKLASASAFLALTLAAQAQWVVINLHPAGASSSVAYAVQGGQQVGYATIGGARHAALWSGSALSWVDLHPLGTGSSAARAVDAGKQAGFSLIGGAEHAGMWSGTPSSWIDLHPPGASSSRANGIKGPKQAGLTVVGGNKHASLWSSTAGSWVDLNNLATDDSAAYALNGGEQVGEALWLGVNQTSLWNDMASSWRQIESAASIGFGADAGSQAGQAIIAGKRHACVWSGTIGTRVDLNPSTADESVAYAVDAGEQAGFASISGSNHAALWQGSGASFFDLHALLPAAYSSSEANGIWHNGDSVYVVGFAHNDTANRDEALMWVKNPPGYTISGEVVLRDFSGNPTSPPITFEIRPPGSQTPVDAHVLQLDSMGRYWFTATVSGLYDVTAKGGRWLRQKRPGILITADRTLDFDLVSGDTDDDNAIGDGDLINLILDFGSPGGAISGYLGSDLSGDGVVDDVELIIIIVGFGSVGD